MNKIPPSTKEWGVARDSYQKLEMHQDNCSQCKTRKSYNEGRCEIGENFHDNFAVAVVAARDSVIDKRKLTKSEGRK